MGGGLCPAQVERSSTEKIGPTRHGARSHPPRTIHLRTGHSPVPTQESLHKSWLKQKHEKVKLGGRVMESRDFAPPLSSVARQKRSALHGTEHSPILQEQSILGRGIARPHTRVTTQKLVEEKARKSKTVGAGCGAPGLCPALVERSSKKKKLDLRRTGHSPVPTQE